MAKALRVTSWSGFSSMAQSTSARSQPIWNGPAGIRISSAPGAGGITVSCVVPAILPHQRQASSSRTIAQDSSIWTVCESLPADKAISPATCTSARSPSLLVSTMLRPDKSPCGLRCSANLARSATEPTYLPSLVDIQKSSVNPPILSRCSKQVDSDIVSSLSDVTPTSHCCAASSAETPLCEGDLPQAMTRDASRRRRASRDAAELGEEWFMGCPVS